MGLAITILKQFGKVAGSRLFMNDLPLYAAILEDLDGKEIELVIKEREKNVTMGQHGYLHGVVIPAALADEQFGGWTAKELSDFITENSIGEKKVKEINDVVVEFLHVPSKATISRKKMGVVIDWAVRFFAEHGITIPPPTKQTKAYADKNRIVSKS